MLSKWQGQLIEKPLNIIKAAAAFCVLSVVLLTSLLGALSILLNAS